MLSNPDPRLAAYVVWVPRLSGTEADVAAATGYLRDKRAQHFWDGDDVLGAAFAQVLDLPVAAWDAYFLYGPGARWDGDVPPPPDLWMHQLRLLKGPRFDVEQLAARAATLLQ